MRGTGIPGEVLGKQGMASAAWLPALGLTAVRGAPRITVLGTGKRQGMDASQTVIHYQGSAADGGRFGSRARLGPASGPACRSRLDNGSTATAIRRLARPIPADTPPVRPGTARRRRHSMRSRRRPIVIAAGPLGSAQRPGPPRQSLAGAGARSCPSPEPAAVSRSRKGPIRRPSWALWRNRLPRLTL